MSAIFASLLGKFIFRIKHMNNATSIVLCGRETQMTNVPAAHDHVELSLRFYCILRQMNVNFLF